MINTTSKHSTFDCQHHHYLEIVSPLFFLFYSQCVLRPANAYYIQINLNCELACDTRSHTHTTLAGTGRYQCATESQLMLLWISPLLVNTCPSTIVAVCLLPSLSLALRLSSAPTVHTVIVHCHHQQVPQFQCYTLVSSTTAAASLHTFCFSMSFCLVCAKSYHLLSGLNAWNASTPSEQWLRQNVSRRFFRVSRFPFIFSPSYLLPPLLSFNLTVFIIVTAIVFLLSAPVSDC